MNSRKEIAELAALLAVRIPTLNAEWVARDALAISRLAASALTNGMRLCNEANYQAAYNRKADSIRKRIAPILERYGLRAVIAGDPRGSCCHLFSVTGPELPGNTMGGRESGYAL